MRLRGRPIRKGSWSTFLRTVTAQLNSHSCSVWLRDPISGLMVFEFALEDGMFKTKSEATLAAISPSLAVEAIPTWAEMFRTKRPIVLEDIRIRPHFPWRAHLLAFGVITMLAVPMVMTLLPKIGPGKVRES